MTEAQQVKPYEWRYRGCIIEQHWKPEAGVLSTISAVNPGSPGLTRTVHN